jgi:hypothetical protein
MEIDLYEKDYHFSSPIFRHKRPDFLPSVKAVFSEYVDNIKKEYSDNVYPGIMTHEMSNDDRIENFVRYVNNIAWDILDRQGYDMSNFNTYSNIWGQYHPYTSSMEKHFHGSGSQLTGFYFLDTPPESSTAFFHDPRSVKVYSNLPVKADGPLTPAYNDVYYIPEPGDFIFSNSWLEHSFTRNKNLLPFNFIHINVNILLKETISADTPDSPSSIKWNTSEPEVI